MYATICHPCVHHVQYVHAHCNLVKIVNVDCMLLNSNCSSPNQEPVVVLFPDPTLKEGKGLVYIEQYLGVDVAFLNSCAPIRFTP